MEITRCARPSTRGRVAARPDGATLANGTGAGSTRVSPHACSSLVIVAHRKDRRPVRTHDEARVEKAALAGSGNATLGSARRCESTRRLVSPENSDPTAVGTRHIESSSVRAEFGRGDKDRKSSPAAVDNRGRRAYRSGRLPVRAKRRATCHRLDAGANAVMVGPAPEPNAYTFAPSGETRTPEPRRRAGEYAQPSRARAREWLMQPSRPGSCSDGRGVGVSSEHDEALG